MSFKSNPFDRFSHLDPESRLSQFRKRFDHLSQNANQMFAEPSLANRWPPMSNGMQSERSGPFDDHEEGVPIKVVHEKADFPTNAEPTDRSSESSFGSSHSQRSGNTSHSSGSAFNSNRSNHSSGSASSQPRVHHIPITVEPRDGSSSGYTSEANFAAEQPLSRSSSQSSAHSINNTVRNRSRTESPAPSNASEVNNEEVKRVRQIPVKVESQDVRRSASPLNESSPKAKNTTTPPKNKSGTKSGPFVTRIPVVSQNNDELQKSEPNTKSDEAKPEKKADPMQEINQILHDLKNYENQVKEFKGTVNDKKYRYLDEMLTRCMIKLDTIETNGNEEIRKSRKAAILAVNQCIASLDQKVSEANESKTQDKSQERQEPMQVSTPEPTSQQINEQHNAKQDDKAKPAQVNEQTTAEVNQSTNPSNVNPKKETAV